MKRWMVLVAVGMLVLSACSDSDDAESGSTAPDGSQEPAISDAPTAGGSVADLAITEVVFGDHVTVTNLGADAVSLVGLWLCNRPSYTELPTAVLAAGESIDLAAAGLGNLSVDGGEVGLYSSNSFGDSASLVDYVTWGSAGGRIGVAVDAGQWPADATVDATGASISAPDGGGAPSDWSSS